MVRNGALQNDEKENDLFFFFPNKVLVFILVGVPVVKLWL